MPTISARDLAVAIGRHSIFSGVSFDCAPGCMMALTGPSGCGKSTLLNTLGLVLRPAAGDVLLDGAGTRDWNDRQRFAFWKEHAAFIHQDYGVIDDENLVYNITLGGQLKSSRYAGPDQVLGMVGLAGRSSEQASVLSGGEKQRLGIARALYKGCHILYADEPTASLDPVNRDMIISLLQQLSSRGVSVLVATHDDYLARACSSCYRLG